jgi:perosamine synthetase
MSLSDNPRESLPFDPAGQELTAKDQLEAASLLSKIGWSLSDHIAAFESSVRSYTGSQYTIAVSSSAAGLELCLEAMGIQEGDFVITTPLADGTSVSVLLSHGAVPIFVDVEPRTGNIDPHLVFAAVQDIMYGGKNAQAWLPSKGAGLEGKLKAILPVDVFGQPVDLEIILNTAWKYQLKVIEDARHALGSAYNGHLAGTLADLGVYEFYSNQPDPPGGSGMLLTDDQQYAELIYAWRDQSHTSHDNVHQSKSGTISYLPDAQSTALGLVYMRRLEQRLASRSQVAAWYSQRLTGIPGIEIPVVAKHTSKMSWSAYPIRLAADFDRDAVVERLAANGIHAKADFLPLHLQPDIKSRYGYQTGTFPVAEELGQRSLLLPFSGFMSISQVEQVCQALKQSI